MSTLKRVPSWISLTLLALGLRLFKLGSENLWYDESFTAWLAGRLSWSDLWLAIKGDVHPPLFYLLEAGIARVFGTSETAIRLLPAFCGVLSVLLVWRLALALKLDRATAFRAGIVAAVLPGSLYYGQESRMYTLLACFVLLACWMAITERWPLFFAACAGAVYTQNLGVFYVAALGAAVVLCRLRAWRSLVRPVLALAGVVAAWLPWGSVLAHQAGAVGSGFWLEPLTPGGVLWPFASITMGWRLPDALQVVAYLGVFGLSGAGLIACRKWLISRSGVLFLSVVFGAPGLAALVSVFWRSIYLPRALLPSALALVIMWAYPLTRSNPGNRRAVRLVLVPCLAAGLLFHYLPANGGRQDIDSFLAPVRAGWRYGDIVYHTALHTAILYGYYLPDLDYEIRPEISDLNESLTAETQSAMGFPVADFEDLRAMGYKRAWLLIYTNPMSRITELIEINRIVRGYHASAIQVRETDYAKQAVYLVDLQ